ncbi:MAG: PTS sugar transporter subunit IIC [Hespellia sp.]|nr:PTS sugar transporter subunit IIC [Hespellia sp.]
MGVLMALIITLVVWVITWAEAWFAYPMINTPLVLCPIVGFLLGDFQAGIIAGATLQLVFLGVMQIGGTLPADASLGAVIGVAFSITLGQDVETALTFAVPIAALGSTFTLLKYIINGLVNPYVEKLVEKGDAKGIERVHVLVSFLPDLPKMAILFVALAWGTGFAQGMLDAIPAVVQSGLDYATGLMPAVGFALLLRMMWSKQMAVYFFFGVILVCFFNVPIIGVACVGLILAIILESNDKGTAVATVASDNGEEDLFND